MINNATGEWYGQYCSSEEYLPATEETEMTIEQVMSIFKESVETYGDTIKVLTNLTGADADIADQVLSIAENPE